MTLVMFILISYLLTGVLLLPFLRGFFEQQSYLKKPYSSFILLWPLLVVVMTSLALKQVYTFVPPFTKVYKRLYRIGSMLSKKL